MFPFIAVHAARRTFVLLCLLPTMSVITWATARRLPGGSVRAAHRLGQVLRLESELANLETLRPGEIAYRQLRLGDPIKHDWFVSFPDSLTVRQVGATRDLRAPRMELNLLALPRLVTWFETHVYDSVARTEGEFTCNIEAVDLCQRDEKWDLGACTATVQIMPNQSRLTLTFFKPDDTLQRFPFVQIQGVCEHGASPPQSTWEFDVREIPLRWGAPFWSLATQFGAQSQWRSGKVVWHSAYEDVAHVTLKDCLIEQVDLSDVSASWLDAPLQGLATVDVATWEFTSQDQRGHAYVQCPQGSLDSSWLERLKSQGRTEPGRREVRAFTELHVEIKSDQLRWTVGPIRSSARPSEPLPIMRDEQSALLVTLQQPISLTVRRR